MKPKSAPTSTVKLCALDDKFISSFFSCLWDSVWTHKRHNASPKSCALFILQLYCNHYSHSSAQQYNCLANQDPKNSRPGKVHCSLFAHVHPRLNWEPQIPALKVKRAHHVSWLKPFSIQKKKRGNIWTGYSLMWDCLHPSYFQLIPDLHHTQRPYVGFASLDSGPRQVSCCFLAGCIFFQPGLESKGMDRSSLCKQQHQLEVLLHPRWSSAGRRDCMRAPWGHLG